MDSQKSLLDWEGEYRDTSDDHRRVVETFKALTDTVPWLKEHRDFVEKHVYGFGERSFHWMWKLLVDQMPHTFDFLEVGVYKGQIPSLVRLISDHQSKTAQITGVTPLSSFSGVTGKEAKFPDEDYMQHIKNLHAQFHIPFSEGQIIKGDSTDPEIQEQARKRGPFDIVFVDGCHEYDFVVKDLKVYGEMVKPGGYLVVDDSSNFLHLYWGAFPGIEDVSRAVRDVIETDPKWKQVFVVMHDRVFRKIG
jgi:SAM-dependent methyltransferase